MFITKDKQPQKKEDGKISIDQARIDEIMLRIASLENIVCEHLSMTKKELTARFFDLRQEAIISSSFEHENNDLKITLDPIVVTNE